MPTTKIKIFQPQKKLYVIDAAFLISRSETVFQNGVEKILVAMPNNTNFPDPTPSIASIQTLFDEYDALRIRCLTDSRSPRTINERTEARYQLSRLVYKLIWYIQIHSDNDYDKLTQNTGLKVAGMEPRKERVRLNAPSNVSYTQHGVDPITTLRGIRVLMDTQIGNKGCQYRVKMDGQDDYGAVNSFDDNQTRIIPGFRFKDSGVFQVRWIGGLGGQSNWSDEIPFIVG